MYDGKARPARPAMDSTKVSSLGHVEGKEACMR